MTTTDTRTQISDAIWGVTDEGTFEHGTDGQSVVNAATVLGVFLSWMLIIVVDKAAYDAIAIGEPQ